MNGSLRFGANSRRVDDDPADGDLESIQRALDDMFAQVDRQSSREAYRRMLSEVVSVEFCPRYVEVSRDAFRWLSELDGPPAPPAAVARFVGVPVRVVDDPGVVVRVIP